MTVVVTSWVLIVLAIFGLVYMQEVRVESRLLDLEQDKIQVAAYAGSGIEYVKALLENNPQIDCVKVSGVNSGQSNAEPVPVANGFFAIGVPVFEAGEQRWISGFVDEGSKIPLGQATLATLAKLPGMTERGINTILQVQSDSPNEGIPAFDLIAGLDETSLASAKRYLSLYAESVNINSASFEVLVALGLPERAVGKILQWRHGPDGLSGTQDDRLFSKTDSNSRDIVRCGFNSEEAAIFAYLCGSGVFSTVSHYFQAVSRGWGTGVPGVCEIQVVLEKTSRGPVIVINWRQKWIS